MAHAFTKHVQWNLRTMDTLGTSVLSTCIQLLAGGTQFVHCREVVHSSECPLSEVSLYIICFGLSVCLVLCMCVCVCSNKLRTYTNPGLFTLLSFSVQREQTELNPALFCPAVSLSVTV